VNQLVGQQEDEIIRALSGRGQYRLPKFSHLAVSPSQWAKMRPDQRREVVERFDYATMKSITTQVSRHAAPIPSVSFDDVKNPGSPP